MATRSSFVMETNQKESRQIQPKQRDDRRSTDYDTFEHKAQSYKRREKYQSWKHQTYDVDEGWDD